MKSNIDFVIMWVDGNDTEWQKEKAKYQPGKADIRSNRYRDWETLKYLFRGIDKFAPWVEKVHFITWGHLPQWLDTNNKKLHIVNHKDYIPEQYLPTFNSNTIELNMHRIEGLSEQFVQFNDDFFLLKPVSPEDFFKDGLPCDNGVLSAIVSYDKDGFSKSLQANMGIINTHFDKNTSIKKNIGKWFNFKYGAQMLRTVCLLPWRHFTGFYDHHIPCSFLRTTFETLWEKEYDILNNTCLSRFRDNNTNITGWTMRYWQLASGCFNPRSIKIGHKFQYEKDNSVMYDALLKRKYKMICLNDNEADYDFETEKQRTLEIFEQILPDKSSFEK